MKEEEIAVTSAGNNLPEPPIGNTETTKPEPVAMPPSGVDSWQKLLDFISAKNPFYLISALLIIYAQSAIFTSDPLMQKTEIPALLLAGYTVLLAAAGVLIVRFGKVWDDARSVVLLVLALLQILPVCADGIALNTPVQGRFWLGGIFLFSVGVSEMLRRGLKIKIPGSVLAAYYGLLALFCAWPAILAKIVEHFEKNTLPSGQMILSFPVAVAVLLLTLIPAIRRGAAYFDNNGTPWRWPWFPLGAFGLIAIGAACRTYLLTISFIGGKGAGPYSSLESGFQLWMLLPIILAVSVLILEYAAVSKNTVAAKLAIVMPFVMLFCSFSFKDIGVSSRVFHDAIPGHYSPLTLTFPFILAYLAWGWYRGVKYADIFFHVGLGSAAFIVTASTREHGFALLPGGLIMLVFVADMVWMACRTRYSAWSFFAGVAVIFDFSVSSGHDVSTTTAGIIAAAILLNFYLNGAFFRDKFASALNSLAATAIPFYMFFAILSMFDTDEPSERNIALVAMVGLSVMAIIGFFWIERKPYRNSLAACGVILGVTGGIKFAGWAKDFEINFKGIGIVAGSLLTLALAVAVSLCKGRKITNNVREE